MTTQELRDTFLLTGLFAPGQLTGTFTDLDRLVAGGIMPAGKAVELPNHRETGRAFFLERRELGAINVGGAGAVHADGKTFSTDKLDCVYLPMGTKSVTFESKDAGNPAKFYFLSCPAHAAHPAAMMKPKEASPVPLGSQAAANKRTIYKYIHQGGIQSCQLVMGFTALEEGNVWNSIPAAHALAAHGDLFLLRPRRERADAFHGRAAADAASVPAQRGSRAVAELVHPLRLRHGQLQVHLGHGRRKPGVRRHGRGEAGGFAVSGTPVSDPAKRNGKHRTFNIQRPTFNGGVRHASSPLDVRCWLLVVECFPPSAPGRRPALR